VSWHTLVQYLLFTFEMELIPSCYSFSVIDVFCMILIHELIFNNKQISKYIYFIQVDMLSV